MADGHLYKILSAPDWAQAQETGESDTALDRGDGFVHLSTGEQVASTLALHYRGQEGVRLLEFRADTLDGELRWEPARGGTLFPHLYGRLVIAKAERVWTLSPGTDGVPQLPEELAS